jgi:hypothetical protein
MPRNLRITSNANGKVRFEWEDPINPSGLIEYKFWMLGVPISAGKVTTQEFDFLAVGKTHTFKIFALYEDNISSDDSSIDFTQL